MDNFCFSMYFLTSPNENPFLFLQERSKRGNKWDDQLCLTGEGGRATAICCHLCSHTYLILKDFSEPFSLGFSFPFQVPGCENSWGDHQPWTSTLSLPFPTSENKVLFRLSCLRKGPYFIHICNPKALTTVYEAVWNSGILYSCRRKEGHLFIML